MNVTLLLRALVAGWWIIAASTVAGAGIAAAVAVTTPPTFKSTTSYYVSVAGQESSAVDIAQGSTAAQQKIKSYIKLASSPRVLQSVIDEMDLDTSAASLGNAVTATVDSGTVVLNIAVTDSDPRTAARVAETIGRTLARLVEKIEPATAGGDPSVTFEEISPATVPSSPIAPKKTVDVALGLVAGLAMGISLALVRAALDTRVRSAEDLDVEVPVIGDIAFDPEASDRPLIVRDAASSVRAESFRSLRTNIQFLGTGEARTIAVTSARPAEGKTTTTANLAIALSESGLRTVVVDADLRRPSLASKMGIDGSAGLVDLLIARAELEDVLQPWGNDALTVLPSGIVPPNPSELIGSEAMERLLALLAEQFDVVLVDTPPMLAVTDAAIISTRVSTTLLVTAANQTKRSDVRHAVEALARVGQRAAGLVLTKTRHKSARSGYYRYAYDSASA